MPTCTIYGRNWNVIAIDSLESMFLDSTCYISYYSINDLIAINFHITFAT